METRNEPLSERSCLDCEIVACAEATHLPGGAFNPHLEVCALCLEELEGVRAFLNANASAEVAQTYEAPDLALVPIPDKLVHKLFPRTAWESLLGELKELWSVSPFATIAWEPVRFEVDAELGPGRRPRYYLGQTVTLRLRVYEDCYVTIVHLDPEGHVRQISPASRDIISLPAGSYEFSGTIQGAHDEVHRLVAVAMKTKAGNPTFTTSVSASTWLADFKQELHALPPGEYSCFEYAYRVADPRLTSLDELQDSCQLEISDRQDLEKAACNEVGRRALDASLSEGTRREAFALLYKITSRLVSRWIARWLDQFPSNRRYDCDGYIHEVYSRLLSAKLEYRGYFPLLRYLKKIVLYVILHDYRVTKRQIVSASRRVLNGFASHSTSADTIDTLMDCLRHHGVSDPLDQALLRGLLRAQEIAQVKTDPIIQTAFAQSRATDIEKFIYNRRDTAVWHAFVAMRGIERHVDLPDPCHQLVTTLSLVTTA